MTATCAMKPVYLPEVFDCNAELDALHDPGCSCLECMAPYSMPYTPGPGCGKPWCRCKKCDGHCKPVPTHVPHFVDAPAVMEPPFQAPVMKPNAFQVGNMTFVNIIIALIVAYVTYRLLRR